MEVTAVLAIIALLKISAQLAAPNRGSFKEKQTWTYELKSVETYSDNRDLLSFDEFKVERVSRGVYAASGNFTIKFDIVEGDDNEIEVNTYRSENGVREYRPIAFQIQRQHLFSYFNTFYKDVVMETFRKCSNLPVIEDKFEPPFEKKLYIINKCQFDQSGLPPYLQEGFYKVEMRGYGTVNWYITFVFEVQNVM